MPGTDPLLHLPFLIGAILAAAAAVGALVRYRTALARSAAVFMFSIAVHLFAYAQLLAGPDLPAAQFWVRLQWIVYQPLLVSWLLAVILLAGRSRWNRARLLLLISAVPAWAVVALLLSPAIDPGWMSQGIMIIGSVMILGQSLGAIGVVFIAYAFGIGILTAGLLHSTRQTADTRLRRLATALLAGIVAILLISFLEVLGLHPLAPISLIELGYALGAFISFVAVFGLSFGSSTSTLQKTVYDNIRDGVIVLDRCNRVTELNTAAMALIGPNGCDAVGRVLAEVWPQSAPLLVAFGSDGPTEGEFSFQVNGTNLTYDVVHSTVNNAEAIDVGHILVLRNVTGRERMEKALQSNALELARTNRLMAALSLVTTRLGSSTDSNVILDALGDELRKLGLDCAVVIFEPDESAATIRYLSFNPSILRTTAKLTGFSLLNHRIPRHLWPGDRVLREKAPVWYPNPSDILRRMFPQLSDTVADTALKTLGVEPAGQICILPLISGARTIGAMPIWGADLRPEDSLVLGAFAGQVGVILDNTLALARENVRADELARSNALILALAKVAARLDSTADFAEVVDTFGNELKKMGVECLVGTLDEGKQNLRLRYISINPSVLRWAERVTGHTLSDLEIPRRMWPSDKVVMDKTPYWDPRGMYGTLNIFPILAEGVHKQAMKLAGIRLEDPVCYLPLAHEEDVIGLLAVWGPSLRPADVPALSVFSNQLATAIRNTEVFEQQARRSRELAILLEASEATSSSSQLDQVLLTLAAQLLEISGFDTCQISEWDKNANQIAVRANRTRVFWGRYKQEPMARRPDPAALAVLTTGAPGLSPEGVAFHRLPQSEARSAASTLRLPIRARQNIIGLAEFVLRSGGAEIDEHLVARCSDVLDRAADWLRDPLWLNEPQALLDLANELTAAAVTGNSAILGWDRDKHQLVPLALAADTTWETGRGPTFKVAKDDAWWLALDQGRASVQNRISTGDGAVKLSALAGVDPEALVVFPLQSGTDRIGLVELYDYNHERAMTPAQVAFLRTVADKAGYSIQNARLLQETQKRLLEKTSLLGEKEILLKEVHHRVKNNLQVISSLLSLQSSQIQDARVRDALRESQNRVRTMALIHEKLYQSTDLAHVDFAVYLRSLVTFLSQSYRDKADGVTLDVQATETHLDIETAIPCGLIVNELVSNALKHAFPGGRNGTVRVGIGPQEDGRLCLHVSDDGVGLPAGLSVHTTASLGMSLVHTLTDQLGGIVEVRNGVGTEFRILFSPPEPRPRD